VLQPQVAAAALDGALVVPLAGSAEARLEGVVRDEVGEARTEQPRLPQEHLGDGGSEVVVGDGGEHAGEVRERCDVGRQEPGGVLVGAEHREVAPRVQQAHEEHPRLGAHAGELDPDLEEVHLGELAGRMHEGHGDLPLAAAQVRDEAAHGAGAGLVATLPQQLREALGGQPLLARGEGAPVLPEGLGLHAHRVANRSHPRVTNDPRTSNRLGPRVATDRIARQTELPRNLAERHALGEHLVPNHSHQIHGNHPGR
jgi:hypothetical protein